CLAMATAVTPQPALCARCSNRPPSIPPGFWRTFPAEISVAWAPRPCNDLILAARARHPCHVCVVDDTSNIFTDHVDFDPAGDFEAFLKSVPARWVVYLMSDADGQPIQLLCVKNLRASLKRRLGGEETIGPTRKVNYRDVVRRVSWRRV